MLSLTSRWLLSARRGRNSVMPAMALLALGAVGSVLGGALVDSAAAQTTPSKPPVPALYPTRAEAEKAAKLHFQCTGAHPMDQQWMPCANHGHNHGSHP